MVSKQRPKSGFCNAATVAAALVAILLSVGVVAAPVQAADAPLARDVARADACRRLRDRIAALKLSADRTIGDFLETSPAMTRFVRETVVAAPIIGEPTEYSDGSFDVTIDLPLNDLERRFYATDGLLDLEGFPADGSPGWLADINKTASIRVTGIGYPPARSYPPPEASRVAPVWQSIAPAGQRITFQAAMLDADRQLRERAAAVEIQRGQTLADLCSLNAEFQRRCDDAIDAATDRNITFGPDLVCVVTQALPVRALVPMLKQLHERAGHLSPLRSPDWDALAAALGESRITIAGAADAPPEYCTTMRPDLAGIRAPAWAGETLTVAESGDASADVAMLLARQQLAARIDDLPLAGGLTVSDVIVRHDGISADLSAYLFGVQPLAARHTASGDAGQTVTLAAPLERLWLLVARELSVDELRAVTAAAAAATPPAVAPQPDPG